MHHPRVSRQIRVAQIQYLIDRGVGPRRRRGHCPLRRSAPAPSRQALIMGYGNTIPGGLQLRRCGSNSLFRQAGDCATKAAMDNVLVMEGNYAVVTGSTRGIGRAMAGTLARHGCNIVVSSRNAGDCERTAKELAAEHGVRTVGLPCDVSVQSRVSAMFREIRGWCDGRLDVLICNAGYPLQDDIFNTPMDATPADKLEEWYLSVFRTDALGSVFCTYEALPMMLARGRGSIIYVSSIPALAGYQGAPYTVAKAGILGLMKEIAREYGRHNIRANALALGNIRTPATYDMVDEATRQLFAEQAPLRRWGLPEEVGGAALFLASEQSGFITGQTLVVDGGVVRR
jgi:3-oxoacyl-[acyl-carrier protein] reductase